MKTDPNDEYPQAEFFQGKVDFEIDGRIEQVWLKPKAENVLTFASANQSKLVNFDFESTWIKGITFEKSLDELLYQLENSRDILARSAAMIELVKVGKNEKTTAEDKAKIHAALRNIIVGNSYWRLRNRAITQLQILLGTHPLDEPR